MTRCAVKGCNDFATCAVGFPELLRASRSCQDHRAALAGQLLVAANVTVTTALLLDLDQQLAATPGDIRLTLPK